MNKVVQIATGLLLCANIAMAFEHIESLRDFKHKTERGNVIVEFYAEWCGPCHEMKQNLEKLNRKKDKIKIYQVNIEKAQEVVDMYGTPQVPALLYMKDGKILQGYVGLKHMSELKRDIKRYFHAKKRGKIAQK